MRPRTALFIVTSFWAYGELGIAMEFAKRLPPAGYRPLFLVPPAHGGIVATAGLAHQVLVPNAAKINRIQLADIAHTHQPALVILADFINFDFCERHFGLRRADLAVFDCPVGTFDDFAWGRPGTWLDTYGFPARHEAEVSLAGLAFRLRPCPLNDPTAPHPPDVHPYPLLSTVDEPAGDTDIRAELGLPADRPLVLLTGASWQHMHAPYPAVAGFVEACRTMLERVLRQVLPHADVVSVGPPTVFVDGSTPEGYHAIDQLAPDRFAALADTVSLYVSNNIVSVSLHRLALRGIPTVALFSSLERRDGQLRSLAPVEPKLTEYAADLLGRVPEVYPFRMFPVGWYHFLDSLLAGNPFTGLVTQVESFDELACADAILTGLERPSAEANRQSYLDSLSLLPDVATILHDIAEARV